MKNLFRVFILLVFASTGFAKNSEEEKILKVYSRVSKEYKKYIENTMQNRQQFESFSEDVFEPAVGKMVIEINNGRCKSCLVQYLEASVYFVGSASEALWDHLKILIKTHPNKVADACKPLEKDKKVKLKDHFEGSFDDLKADGTKQEEIDHLKKEIAACLN